MTGNLNPVFDSVIPVANYLYNLRPEISPIKLQKALYFLYAYHGGIYYNHDQEGESEGVVEPKTLFNAEFEAWKYGPVIREIYHMNKAGELGNPEDIELAIAALGQHPEEKKFIDNLFEQIDSVSDFSLVERSHQDEAWKTSFEQCVEKKLIDKFSLINEYKEKYI
jgi:uncharacterized phage-associated protein